MNFSLSQLTGSRAGGISWLSAIIGILLFALLSLVLTLVLPGRMAHTTQAAVAINGIAALLAIVLAPFLLRAFDQMQQQVTRQGSELRSLHAIDSAINATLDIQTVLDVAVKEITLAVDGEQGALWLLAEDSAWAQPTAQAFYNLSPGMQALLTERLGAGLPDLTRRTGITQRGQGLEETWKTDRAAATLRLRSLIVVPIKQQDAVLGIFLVGNRGGALNPLEGFTDDDQSLLETISATVAVAIQNARLYQETLRRDEILRTLVARTGDAIAASSDAPLLMQILADEAARILQCRRVAVYAYQEETQEFMPLAAHDDQAARDETGQGRALLVGFFERTLAHDVLTLPAVVTSDQPQGDSPAHYVANAPAALGLRGEDAAFLDSPGYLFVLRSRDRRGIGLLCLLDTSPRLRLPDSAAFARALAAQASVALENAQLAQQNAHLYDELKVLYDREKLIAGTLQNRLLPTVPEQVETIEFAHQYQAALEESVIGGDFFDLFALGKHHMGVVMADVSGKGLKAAVQTAMIKYTLRGFAQENPTAPGEVLARVNDVLCSPMSSHDGFVTLFYGVLNTQTGEMTYANAGHEPPLSRRIGNDAREWPGSDGIALGCLPGAEYSEQTQTLAPGDLLLLYTDGLTEARAADGQFLGSEGLLRLLPRADVSAADAVQTLYSQVSDFAGDVRRDDVAMLLLRRLPENSTLQK